MDRFQWLFTSVSGRFAPAFLHVSRFFSLVFCLSFAPSDTARHTLRVSFAVALLSVWRIYRPGFYCSFTRVFQGIQQTGLSVRKAPAMSGQTRTDGALGMGQSEQQVTCHTYNDLRFDRLRFQLDFV